MRASSVLALLTLFPRTASANDTDGEGFDPIPPPTLPALTHAGLLIDFESSGAGIGTRNTEGTSIAWLNHVGAEYALVPRAWYLGLTWDVASGAVPGTNGAVLYGNPEIYGRAVWSDRTALSIGGGFGFVVPLPRDLEDEAAKVLEVVRVVRPWDLAAYSETTLSFKPAIDVRLGLDPFVIQFRQGLDVSYAIPAARTDIVARAGLALGWTITPWIATNVELWEVYPITAEIPDDERASFTLSPSVSASFPPIRPGISVLFPLSTPLGGAATSFFAVRTHLAITIE